MSDEHEGDLHRLGEQLENLSIGNTGRRDENGNIAAVLGKEGHLFFGPYLALPSGQYSVRMIFAADTPLEVAFGDPGLTLEAVWNLEIIAALPLDEASFEAGVVALPFSVPSRESADEVRQLEIRLHSRGECPLVVTSIDLRRMTATFRHFAAR
jgi:hypothetical protein